MNPNKCSKMIIAADVYNKMDRSRKEYYGTI